MTTSTDQRLLTLLTFFLVSIFYLPCSAEDEIGLYFDTGGTVNCLPDSINFPQEKNIYLILKNCSSTAGVGGWECALSLPAGCFMLSSDLGPQALNVAMAPEYIVGLGTPIPQSPLMVLASFSLLFTAPGEIYLHAPEQNSIEGELVPVYLEGGESGQLVALEYSFGSPLHTVMSVGIETCPVDTVYQTPILPVQPILELLSNPEEKLFVSSGGGAVQKLNIPENWDLYYSKWPLGIRGTIEGIVVECFQDGNMRIGAARLSINVEEIFWGLAERQVIEIWFKGADVQGCIEYTDNLSFSILPDLMVGDEIIVFSGIRNSVFWSNRYAVFPTLDKDSIFRLNERHLHHLRDLGTERHLKRQFSKADLVVLLEPKDHNFHDFYVKAVYVGDKTKLGANLLVGGNVIRKSVKKLKESPSQIFGLFKEDASGAFVLLDGRKSLFLSTEKGWLTAHGYSFDILKALEDMKFNKED